MGRARFRTTAIFPALKRRRSAATPSSRLTPTETARWRKAAEPVIDLWIADMKSKGIDGKVLVDDARAMIARYAGPR